MEKLTVRDLEVSGKKVFCRVDFNVPLDHGKIRDDTRIRAALPTIEYLIEKGARLILASHLGRPQGDVDPELRLDPIARRLSDLLGRPVIKTDEVVGPEVCEAVKDLQNGDVLLLENVRFHPGEKQNDPDLAKRFAELADLYVNDAFGAAHRAHASTEGVARHLPAACGFLLEKELSVFEQALKAPERPFTAIIGGAKVKDKIGVINNLLEKVDNLLIGGGLAYTFLRAKGLDVGQSLVEEDKIELARSLLKKAEKSGVHLHLPQDVVIADEFSEQANTRIVSTQSIPSAWEALDIGIKTREKYRDIIQTSRLVIWNGPMGVFEMKPFAGGTQAVAAALAEAEETYSIIGGGDSAAAVEMFGLSKQMDHVSTGGGASLELLEGKTLPGIAALNNK